MLHSNDRMLCHAVLYSLFTQSMFCPHTVHAHHSQDLCSCQAQEPHHVSETVDMTHGMSCGGRSH